MASIVITIVTHIFRAVAINSETVDTLLLDSNGPVPQSIVVMDGLLGSGEVNDCIYFTNRSKTLPNYLKSTNSKVVVFSDGYRMTLDEKPNISNGPDQIVVRMRDLFEVPLTIWILHDPEGTVESTVGLHVWEARKHLTPFLGAHLSVKIKNVSASVSDLPTEVCCSNRSKLIDYSGFDWNRINVYYVNQVCGGNGRHCGESPRNLILVEANKKNLTTLTHELGHAFGLDDMSDCSVDMGGKLNIMNAGWNVRHFFTLGQYFRCATDGSSSLHGLKLVDYPTYTCDECKSSTHCPSIGFDHFVTKPDDCVP